MTIEQQNLSDELVKKISESKHNAEIYEFAKLLVEHHQRCSYYNRESSELSKRLSFNR